MAQPTQERLAAQLEKPQQTPGNVGHAGSGTGPENAPHFESHEDDHVHHVAMTTYYAVFALLIFLLLITVGAWYVDQHVFSLGKFSTPIAMAIAVAKAVAIVLIFMHVKFSSRLVQIFACTGVAFVTIMFVLTLQDYTTRDWLPRAGVYNTVTSPSLGDTDAPRPEIYRASSVGAASNSQSTPADNTVAMGGREVGNGFVATPAPASGGAAIMGANIRVAPMAPDSQTAPAPSTSLNRESTPAIVGGAANNSFGSGAQSPGIEPKPAPKVPAGVRVTPPAPAAR